MKFRVAGMALVSLMFAALAAHADGGFTAGEQYEVLPIPVQTADPSRIEVVEVFSYGCIHCFSFDPSMEGWRSTIGPDVDFKRIPAVFNKSWELLAQTYITADVLGVVDKVHSTIFNAVHVEHRDLRDVAEIAAIFQAQAGVAPDQFNEVFNSFSVRSRIQQAVARVRAYRVTGVPTLIVNGKYRVDGQLAGSNTRMLEVVDYLIGEELKALAANGQPVTN